MAMNIIEIHNCENKFALDILEKEFSNIKFHEVYSQNYHPCFKDQKSNIFYLLRNGRYQKGFGKYYILLDSSEFIASAGWNQYLVEKNVCLLLTRMYVNPKYRNKFQIGKYILPKMLDETLNFKFLWITCNEYNKNIYNWFQRNADKKSGSLCNQWPDIYKNFVPIGKKNIHSTEQYVVEYRRP